MAIPNAWTYPYIEELKRLWNEGLSASMIAQRLGNMGATFSRSAVLGKVNRLGMQAITPGGLYNGRKANPKPGLKEPNKAFSGGNKNIIEYSIYRKRRERILPQYKEPTTELLDCNIHLLEIRANQCRWVVGKPVDGVMCGAPVKEGPWCHHHHERVYRHDP